MNLTPALRCEIVRDIRVVLVRHFIDMGRLTINISTRGIHLHGYLTRLPGVANRLNPAIIQSIMEELGRLRHVKKVIADFDNWTQSSPYGPWQEVGGSVESRTDDSRQAPGPQVIEIADEPKPSAGA